MSTFYISTVLEFIFHLLIHCKFHYDFVHLKILKREENFDGVVENDKEGQVRLEEPAPKKQGGCCGRS